MLKEKKGCFFCCFFSKVEILLSSLPMESLIWRRTESTGSEPSKGSLRDFFAGRVAMGGVVCLRLALASVGLKGGWLGVTL